MYFSLWIDRSITKDLLAEFVIYLSLKEIQLVGPNWEDKRATNHLRQEIARRSTSSGSKYNQSYTSQNSKKGSSKQRHEHSPWNHESLHEDVDHAIPHQNLCSVVTCVGLKVISSQKNKIRGRKSQNVTKGKYLVS